MQAGTAAYPRIVNGIRKRVAAVLAVASTLAFATALPCGTGAGEPRDEVVLEVEPPASERERIAARVVNRGDRPIWLDPRWPTANVRLQRFDAESGAWIDVSRTSTCSLVADEDRTIRVEPGTARAVEVRQEYLDEHEACLDYHRDRERWLRHRAENGEKAPAPDEDRANECEAHFAPTRAERLRLRLDYALEPWTIAAPPARTVGLTSAELAIDSAGTQAKNDS